VSRYDVTVVIEISRKKRKEPGEEEKKREGENYRARRLAAREINFAGAITFKRTQIAL
jgi:hypothetical protein